MIDFPLLSNNGERNELETTASGISSRLTFLALTDRLTLDASSVKKVLSQTDGPASKQVLAVATQLENDGWHFMRGSPSNSPESRRIYFSTGVTNDFPTVRYALGSAYQPSKMAASVFAHEIGHNGGANVFNTVEDLLRGIKQYKLETGATDEQLKAYMRREFSGGLSPEPKLMGARLILTETRSSLAEMAVAQEVGRASWLTNAKPYYLSGHQMGELIMLTHNVTKEIDKKTANEIATKFIREVHGPNLFDYMKQRINPFDITAGAKETFIAPSKCDGNEIRFDWQKNQSLFRPDLRSPLDQITGYTGSQRWGTMERAVKAGGAAGLFFMVNDVIGGFRKSTADGFQSLARVGVDWMGFEAGAAFARNATQALLVSRPYLGLALTLATGMTTSFFADKAAEKTFGWQDRHV